MVCPVASCRCTHKLSIYIDCTSFRRAPRFASAALGQLPIDFRRYTVSLSVGGMLFTPLPLMEYPMEPERLTEAVSHSMSEATPSDEDIELWIGRPHPEEVDTVDTYQPPAQETLLPWDVRSRVMLSSPRPYFNLVDQYSAFSEAGELVNTWYTFRVFQVSTGQHYDMTTSLGDSSLALTDRTARPYRPAWALHQPRGLEQPMDEVD